MWKPLLCAGLCAGLFIPGARAAHPSPADWRDENLYFIFTDRFYDGDSANNNANPQSGYSPANSRRIHGGDFRGIQQKLDYIRGLGATAIWITPIPQNVGTSGYHGYGADNFYALQPNWGSMADLSNMVVAAHAKGIRVLLDVVANHQGNRIDSTDAGWSAYRTPPAGYNLRWTSGVQYPAPFNSLSNFHNQGHIQNFNDPEQILGELSGLDDLRTENNYVRTNLYEIYKYWIGKADFDGFRLDTVKHCEISLWQYFNPAIRGYATSIGKTNFFQFGEVYDGSEGKCGYYTGTKAGGSFANDSVVNYPLFYKMNSALAKVNGNTRQLEDHFNAIAANFDAYAQDRLVNFLDNHDQIRFMNAANANNSTSRLAVALDFLYSCRGIPCLYYGTEQHFNGSGDPNNREDMFDGQFEQGPSVGDNFNMIQGGYLRVARLNNFRRLYPSLRRGSHVNLWNDSSGPGLFAYARRLGAEEVVVLFNTAGASQTLTNRPTTYAAGTRLVNLLNTNEIITVAPGADGLPPITIPASSTKMFINETLLKALDPQVAGQTPAHDATNIPPSSAIVLRFTQPMHTGTVAAAFSCAPPASGSFSWNAARDTATFTPQAPGFAASSVITVRVAATAAEVSGSNTLFAAFETFFRTSSATFTDTVPPTVAFLLPTNGTILTGLATLGGQAADNAAVARVEFRLDGGDWVAATGTVNWSYAFDTASFLNGSHALSARATDTSGNVSTQDERSVRFSNVPGAFVRRIAPGNASDVTNCDASVWVSDRAFSFGAFGHLNGTNGVILNTISGLCASAQTLYQRERYSTPSATFAYQFACPPGIYETTLLETETWVTNSNLRIFDLYIQGQRMLTNFDIYAQAGGMNKPLTLRFTNVVADALLEMNFLPVVDNARASGIQIRKVGDVDSDADGIPDWWMLDHFDHATGQQADQSRAGDDADGDGVDNLAEFRALTEPQDGSSYPHIVWLAGTNEFGVAIPSCSGRTYTLEATLEGTNDAAWIPLSTGFLGNGSVLWLEDTNVAGQRTYRVRIHAP